jgi:glutamyl-tRNA reductase
VKEKLDAETSLSHEGRRHREAVKGLERKARRIREFAREAKYLHSQLRQSAKEHRNNLECYSRETFNEVICAYTQELVANANRHKRELAQAEAEQ